MNRRQETTAVSAGWAKPKGSDDGLHHWWRTDGRRACDPSNGWAYDGGGDLEPPEADQCEACAVIVIDTVAGAKVLGFDLSCRGEPV